jgi:hypothetical protein
VISVLSTVIFRTVRIYQTILQKDQNSRVLARRLRGLGSGLVDASVFFL